MLYNELFENIIQATNSESEKDYLTWPLEPINFAGEPFHAFESEVFERVLREGQLSIKSKYDKNIIREPKSGLPYLKHYADKIIDIFERLKIGDPDLRKNDRSKTVDSKAFYDQHIFQRYLKNFYIADIEPINKKIQRVRQNFSIQGDFFSISYKNLKIHYKKDKGHEYTGAVLKEICNKITDPFLISWYYDVKTKKWALSFFLKMKIDKKWTLTGLGPSSSFITTIYGWNKLTEKGRRKLIRNVEYIDWNCLNNDIKKAYFKKLIHWKSSPNANKKP
jgi:hypothetical protein